MSSNNEDISNDPEEIVQNTQNIPQHEEDG